MRRDPLRPARAREAGPRRAAPGRLCLRADSDDECGAAQPARPPRPRRAGPHGTLQLLGIDAHANATQTRRHCRGHHRPWPGTALQLQDAGQPGTDRARQGIDGRQRHGNGGAGTAMATPAARAARSPTPGQHRRPRRPSRAAGRRTERSPARPSRPGSERCSCRPPSPTGRSPTSRRCSCRTTGSYRRRSAAMSRPILRQEVLHAQSAQIDLISGATYTSYGYAQSVQSILDQVEWLSCRSGIAPMPDATSCAAPRRAGDGHRRGHPGARRMGAAQRARRCFRLVPRGR